MVQVVVDVGWRAGVAGRELDFGYLEVAAGVIPADLECGDATAAKGVGTTFASRHVETIFRIHRKLPRVLIQRPERYASGRQASIDRLIYFLRARSGRASPCSAAYMAAEARVPTPILR